MMSRWLKSFGRRLTIALTFFFVGASAQAETIIYEVRPGDRLFSILKRLEQTPIYGKNGSLQKTIKLNPQLAASNGDLIFPGDQIHFTPVEPTVKPFVRELAAESEPVATSVAVTAVEPHPEPIKPSPDPHTSSPVPARDDSSSSDIILMAGVLSRRLDAHDSSNSSRGFMSSDADPTLRIVWRPILNEVFSFDFGLQHEQVNIEQAAIRNFLSREQGLTNISFTMNLHTAPRWTLNLGVGSTQTLLYRAINATDLQIDRVFLTDIYAGFHYEFFQATRMKMSLGVGVLSNAPIDTDFYHGETGAGFNAELATEHRLSNFSILGRAFYAERDNSVSTVQFRMRESGIELGLKWNFAVQP